MTTPTTHSRTMHPTLGRVVSTTLARFVAASALVVATRKSAYAPSEKPAWLVAKPAPMAFVVTILPKYIRRGLRA